MHPHSERYANMLPGMEKMSESGKAPHEMSPEEFAAHPYAVFHATTRPESVSHRIQSWLNPETGEIGSGVMHAGTRQAAIDRARFVHKISGIEPEAPLVDPRSGNPSRLYTMWAVPRRKEIATSNLYLDSLATGGHRYDSVTGRPSIEAVGDTVRDEHDTLGYYRNAGEDPGSLSVGTRSPDIRFQRQSDYVKEAIDLGRESEVHPRTLALYKQGTLDEGQIIRNKDIGPGINTQKMLPLDLPAPAPRPRPVHEGGPDLEKIRQQYKFDKGKPGQ